jgi:hypothetical protein
VEAVVAAMSEHKRDRNVQLEGCVALDYLVRAANYTPAPAWADAVRVIVAALQAYGDVVDVHAAQRRPHP